MLLLSFLASDEDHFSQHARLANRVAQGDSLSTARLTGVESILENDTGSTGLTFAGRLNSKP